MKKLIFGLLMTLLAFQSYAQNDDLVAFRADEILKTTAEEYAAKVKAEMAVKYNLTTDQTTQVYDVMLKTATNLHELHAAFTQGIETNMYETKRRSIVTYGEAYLERTLDKKQLVAYQHDRTLAMRAIRTQERQEAARQLDESRQ